MAGGTLQVIDSAGREISGAIDDQPLRVRLELDIDPDSAPDKITVDIVAPDGTKEPIEAERIDWGAERPLYQTELTTIDDTFTGILDVLDPVVGGLRNVLGGDNTPKVSNGQVVHFEYDGLTSDVQTFDSGIDARHWITRAQVADRIGNATNAGIHLTNALRKLREFPESEERDRVERLIEQRLSNIETELTLMELAKTSLDNPKYYAEQQIAAADFFMGIDDLHDRVGLPDVLERSKEIAQGHIVSGVATLTIGGYRMLAQATGVAQLRTMLTGEDEMGNAVTWDGRVTAFLDLVADGMLQGAAMKFQLDNIVAPTRIKTADPRARYDGPSPETMAPELSVVDPSQMGMPPGAIRAAFRTARKYDKIPLVRPTNPDALKHLEAGALPKPEKFKSKTVNELDTLLGMNPDDRALVALFEPDPGFLERAMRGSGMSEADIATNIDALKNGTLIDAPEGFASVELWDSVTKRFIQRSEEFNGATGISTRKLVDSGEIRIEDGLIIDAKTGKVYSGDHDLYDFVDVNGVSVPRGTYEAMVADLQNSEFRAQHGAHKWWDPKREDFPAGDFGDAKFEVAREIYEKIIAGHKQGGEILIAFPPVGPPIAIFSGSAPGQYFGHMPGPWAPAAPGSWLRLPSDIRSFGIAGTAVRGLTPDDSVSDWLASEKEFRTDLEASVSDSTDAFDAAEAAAAARIAQLDADLQADDSYDVDEFLTDPPATDTAKEETGTSDTEASDTDSTDAFDAAAAAAAARTAQLDANLEADDSYDVDEFLTDPPATETDTSDSSADSTGGRNVGLMAAAAAVAVVLTIGGFIWLFGGGTSDTADESATAAGNTQTVDSTLPTTTLPTSTLPEDTSQDAGIAPASADLSDVPFSRLWLYKATKTSDVVAPPDFLSVAPVGTAYEAILAVEEDCTGTVCEYRTLYDLERLFLDVAEVGKRTATAWEIDGTVWVVKTEAHTMQSDTAGVGTCVVLNTETWVVNVTDAVLVDGHWVASSFEGSLARSTELDHSVSTAGSEHCGVWHHVDEWAVTGVAVTEG